MLKAVSILLSIAALVGLAFAIDADSRLKHEATPAADHCASLPICAPGRVEGMTEEIQLRPELHGSAVEIAAREADHVPAGGLLIRLDNSQQEYEAAVAEAELAQAEAELDRLVNGAREEERREAAAKVAALNAQLAGLRRRQERMSSLQKTGAATEQELDDLGSQIDHLQAQLEAATARCELLAAPAREDELRRARARVAAAESKLEIAYHECSKTVLRAPMNAQVLKVNVRLGEFVGPEMTQPAVVMSDTSTLFVRAYVDEFDAPRLQNGMKAHVKADGLPQSDVHGRVVRLAPRMTQKPLRTDDPLERLDTKVREVWIELEKPGSEKLVVGLPVDVTIETAAGIDDPQKEKAVTGQQETPADD